MPTQRSFLGTFLAAFRVHSQPPIAKTSATSLGGPTSGAGSSATLWTATTAVSLPTATADHSGTNPRAIHSKPNPYLSSAGAAAAAGAPPSSTAAAATATIQHNVSPQTHLGRSPSGPASPVYGPPNKPTPNYPTCQEVHGPRRRRRSSDSSSDSGRFREARGAGGEKFFIGGRTAGGEERYYKLSMVKRERSADRISADQLSL